MKKLHFQYKMDLTFSDHAREHHIVLKCRPMEQPGQTLTSFVCRTDPVSALCEVQDGFGNRCITGTIREAHDHFSVLAEGTVERTMQKETVFHPMYRYPSAYTQVSEPMRRFVETMLSEQKGQSPLQQALGLMERMQERMVYTPGVTDTRTTAGEAFALGCGVCQDYAHILTALCRAAGIAARYAAGMMTGEGASHAWTEVWDGQFWHGLDPTHNCLVDERYIKLSHGRDFMDAAVDRGCFLGTASQQQTILIKVEEK